MTGRSPEGRPRPESRLRYHLRCLQEDAPDPAMTALERRVLVRDRTTRMRETDGPRSEEISMLLRPLGQSPPALHARCHRALASLEGLTANGQPEVGCQLVVGILKACRPRFGEARGG